MKKLISIFLILCIMATLLPTVAFASEGEAETVAPIVAEFTTLKLVAESPTKDVLHLNGQVAEADGFSIVTGKTTGMKAYVGRTNDGLEAQLWYGSSVTSGHVWPNKTNNNMMLTINVNADAAGYYSPEVVFNKHDYSGDFAVYINNQYAGEIKANAYGVTTCESESAGLNTVYLNEGANEVSFKVIKHYLRSGKVALDTTWLYVDKLTLTPYEESFVPVTFSYVFPEKVVAGQPEEFTVSANINEALTKFIGTHNEDGSDMADFLTFSSDNGTVEIAETTDYTVKGTFTAAKGGVATITATANVNGKTYTETIETTAVAPIVADFSTLKLVQYESGKYKLYADITENGVTTTQVATAPEFGIVTEKSTSYRSYIGSGNVGLNTQMWSSPVTDGKTWPDYTDKNLMLTISVNADAAGYYTSEVIYNKHDYSGDFAVYINKQYAGEINANAYSVTTCTPIPTDLNTVYLNKGENEVSFKVIEHYKRSGKADLDGTWLYVDKLTLTPCEDLSDPVNLTYTFPEKVVAGESTEFTASVAINGDLTKFIGTNNEDGSTKADLITFSSDDGTVEITETTGNTVKGTFTAKNGGAATITATANVNGKTYTKDINVTVTSDEDEEVTLPTISMSVSTDAACAGNLTVNGDTQTEATLTYSAKVGDTVTVVAKDIEGKTFRGWLRGGENGTPVWAENTYTFKAATNVALYAMYTDAPVAGDSEYYDWNGEFLACEEPDTSTLSKYGFSFKEWLDAVVNDITRYVANYDTTNTYKITKPDTVTATVDDKAAADLTAVAHDAKVTLTNDSVVSWYVNGNPVAYGASYTFYATENAAVTIDNEVQEGPIVNLTNPEGDTYILEYNANGKTVIEKGIVFGGDGASVASCSYKVISQRNADFGKLMAENDESSTVVRGYIIYNDNGIYRVAYADIAK